MATIRVFEELAIWQMASEQSQRVWKLISNGCFAADKALADQTNRSSGSVMDNIAEGFDRFSKADFRHLLYHRAALMPKYVLNSTGQHPTTISPG